MGKISMFGISGSGKTCYLYAMAQILQGGARQGDFRLSVIANDMQQQAQLNDGYLEMAANGKWPHGTDTTTEYDLCVRVQYQDMYKAIVPNLILYDYAGSVWTNNTGSAQKDRMALMHQFAQSSVVLFLIDGVTLLQAMTPSDLHPSHRDKATTQEIIAARQQISFVENLFVSYKHQEGNMPPVMVVVTKSDVFVDDNEKRNGRALVKEYLPSIFAKGSGINAAIANVSLGTHLGTINGAITGNLSVSTDYNIHLPMVYALYAFLDEVYEGSPRNEQIEIEKWAGPLKAMMKGKIELFYSGKPLIAV